MFEVSASKAWFFISEVNHLTLQATDYGKPNNNGLRYYLLIPKKKVNALLEKFVTSWLCERTHVVIYNVQRKGSFQSASFQINFGNPTEKFLRLCFFYLSSPSYIVRLIWDSGTFALLHVQIRGCTVNLSTPKTSNYNTHKFFRISTLCMPF